MKRIRHARWTVRSRLAEHRAYLPLARHRYDHMVVGEQSEMLIDGFTRSACVFAAVAFQLAQQRPVRLAHLIHSTAHILDGVRREVPCMVTVREPEGVVLSCMVREPQTTPAQVLRAHARFYRTLVPYRDRLVVAEFERITTDMDGLIREVNDRFGTSFAEFVPTPENVEAVFAFIDERAQKPPWERHIGYVMSGIEPPAALDRVRMAVAPSAESADRVARPSAHKERRKEQLRAAYLADDLAGLRAEATEAYLAFTRPG